MQHPFVKATFSIPIRSLPRDELRRRRGPEATAVKPRIRALVMDMPMLMSMPGHRPCAAEALRA